MRNLFQSFAILAILCLAGLASTSSAQTCPCSIWPSTTTPGSVDGGDPSSGEYGLKFQTTMNGYITGIRFYKSAANTGTHVGHLWGSSGTLLASATFTNESASGWQQVTFDVPVAVTAGTTYVASYFAPNGHYSHNGSFFTTPVNNPPLIALADGANGVYAYGATSQFPASSWNSSNYWVDVVFNQNDIPSITATTPAAGTTGVSVTTAVSVTFSEAIDATSVTSGTVRLLDAMNNQVPATVTYSSTTRTATLQPTSSLSNSTTYTAIVEGGSSGLVVRNLSGNGLPASFTWAFTTVAPTAPVTCPCSVWPSSTIPQSIDGADSTPGEYGFRFRSTINGFITGIRFYKSAANSGTHIGHLWSNGGALLASATFIGETASGWQDVALSPAVAVTAGTTYVASYFAPNGHYSFNGSYFANPVSNAPLVALANGTDGANGVYSYSSTGVFPSSSWNAGNYWVDVDFDTIDTPSVTTYSPASGATGVNLSTAITATLGSAVDPTTVTGSTFQLLDSLNNVVSAGVSYNSTTLTATLQPNGALSAATTYTARLAGGSGSPVIKDLSGNGLPATFAWSFSTSAPPLPVCPCSVWNLSTTPSGTDGGDSSSGEFGFRFRSDVNGFITGIRFYKSAANTGTHIAHLWSNTGTLLASATFSGESTTGWQQVSFSAPVAITANTVYVASYFAPSGHYAFNANYFSTAVDNPPLHAVANSAGPNGIYSIGSTSQFPNSTYNSSNYWTDVVFIAAGTQPGVSVAATAPANGATGVGLGAAMNAVFNEPMNLSSLNSGTVFVADASGNPVPGTLTYATSTNTATFQPTTELAPFATYTGVVKGTVSDAFGDKLGSDVTWTFTTGAPPSLSGPGGPILVISSSSNPYTRYYDEILRAEGLNEFTVQDISTVTPATLAISHVAILGDMVLTGTQVSMLSNWVQAGGRLIAMHPDHQLASLLGLTSMSQTMSDEYLLVNTGSGAGTGITNQTIQYHGPADLYSLNGATSIATLYSGANAATISPAVSLRSVGSGQAAAFTYDLARSVIYTRQGDPAWAGQERMGTPPIRAVDMFYGAAPSNPGPDWVDLSKVQIPQADEQQRLLANLILQMNSAFMPLPRFWYFPNGVKAVIIMTGDDHNHGGTVGRFNTYIADSPANCSVPDWQCVRSTSYIWPGTPITAAQATAFTSQGFEISIHPDSDPTCSDWTTSQLSATFAAYMSGFSGLFPSLPAPTTVRVHCTTWSDYDSEPQVELANKIRLDVDYYYIWDSWVQDRPGFFTGSGMPMRFADHNGNTIDVYQATTQFPDETTWNMPADMNTVLNNALGPLGYYGVFTTNFHTDNADSPDSDAVVPAAQALKVPIVSSVQMLTWLDGRNSSSFGALSWSGTTLSFTITVGTGARNLMAMLPVTSTAGTLQRITLNGTNVSFTKQTIKGVQYAFFTATAGAYQAVY